MRFASRERFADDVLLARQVVGARELRRARQQRLTDLRREHLGLREVAERDAQPAGAVDVRGPDAAARRADRGAAALLLRAAGRASHGTERRRAPATRPRRARRRRPARRACRARSRGRAARAPCRRRSAASRRRRARRTERRAARASCRRPRSSARVVAAAEARDDAVVAREQVDDAALAFVAPLDPDADVERRCGPASAPPTLRVRAPTGSARSPLSCGTIPRGRARHCFSLPLKSRSAVLPTGSGGTPSNDVMTYSLKSAFGQPKSARVNFVGSSGSNDSCSRWSPGSDARSCPSTSLRSASFVRGEPLHQHRDRPHPVVVGVRRADAARHLPT